MGWGKGQNWNSNGWGNQKGTKNNGPQSDCLVPTGMVPTTGTYQKEIAPWGCLPETQMERMRFVKLWMPPRVHEFVTEKTIVNEQQNLKYGLVVVPIEIVSKVQELVCKIGSKTNPD